MKSLLWDIDGTLLTTRGVGAAPFKESIEKFLECTIEFDIQGQAGLTDHQIVKLHIERKGMERTHLHLIHQIVENYAVRLHEIFKISPVHTFPGIKELLEKLHQNSEISLAIATGNCMLGAQEKLKSAGLTKFFDKSRIFCSINDGPRSEILHRALLGLNASAHTSIVIGDTIHDQNAAKALGIPFLLVVNEQSSTSNVNKFLTSPCIGPSWIPSEFEKVLRDF